MNTSFVPTLSNHIRVMCLALLSGLISTAASAAESWPSFQNGGNTSYSSADGKKLEDAIAWKSDIPGYGQSSPVVWSGHVYVTSVEGANKETNHVTAFDLQSGKKLWQYDLPNATPQEVSNYVSKAAPTPAADADGIICFFEGGNVVALTHDGKVRWERNLVAEYGPITSRHGLSASVEQDADSAYIWVERGEAPYVLSVAKKTGETKWKVDGINTTSWASPRLVPVSDGQHLVLSGVGKLVGLDPKSGETLWTFENISGNSTPTPMPLGDGRFLIGATVGREAGSAGNSAESNGVIAITKDDAGKWKADYVWKAKRATSSFGSPIAHNGMAYFVNRSGVLYALDLSTGEEKFVERLDGSIWATPIAVGEDVWFFGKDGHVNTLSGNGDKHTVATWNQLPADAPSAQANAEGSQRGEGRQRAEGGQRGEGGDSGQRGPGAGPSPSSGSVLYGASLCDGKLVLRRGDGLFAVKVIPAQ